MSTADAIAVERLGLGRWRWSLTFAGGCVMTGVSRSRRRAERNAKAVHRQLAIISVDSSGYLEALEKVLAP